MAKQQAKSPAEKYAEENTKAMEVLAVTYTTTDGKEFHSEPLIVTEVKGGETQEKLTSKRNRDSQARQDATTHQKMLNIGATEIWNPVRKLTPDEFTKAIKILKKKRKKELKLKEKKRQAKLKKAIKKHKKSI